MRTNETLDIDAVSQDDPFAFSLPLSVASLFTIIVMSHGPKGGACREEDSEEWKEVHGNNNVCLCTDLTCPPESLPGRCVAGAPGLPFSGACEFYAFPPNANFTFSAIY